MIINANGYVNKNSTVDLLWENPTPTSAFSAQTINVDTSGYEMLYVMFLTATDYTYLNVSAILNNSFVEKQVLMSGAGMTQVRRNLSITDAGIVFENGFFSKNSASGTISNGNGTKYAVPYRIYGRK